MRWYELIPLSTYLIIGYLTVIASTDVARAQSKMPTARPDMLAFKLKCQDFHKSSEGQWTSRPNTRIGKLDFSSHTFGVGEVDIGGTDLATTLNQKCVAN